jgi:hypothetical protein
LEKALTRYVVPVIPFEDISNENVVICLQTTGEPSRELVPAAAGAVSSAAEVQYDIDPYALNLMYHESALAVGIENPAPMDLLDEAACVHEVWCMLLLCCWCVRAYA